MHRYALSRTILILSLLLGSGTILAQSRVPTKITVQEARALVILMQADSRLPKDFSGFSATAPGKLDPVLVITGIHCILPSKSESLHGVQYWVGSGPAPHRMVLTFTVSPPVAAGQGGVNLAALLANRQLTQYRLVTYFPSDRDPEPKRPEATSTRTDNPFCLKS
jgi:hypothetical protein